MLRLMDGFDHMTAAELVTYNKWTSISAFGPAAGSSDTHRRFAGNGQYLYFADYFSNIAKSFGANEATGIFGFAFKRTNLGVAHNMLALRDAGTVQCFLGMNAANQFVVCRNTTANVLGTSTATIVSNTWYYVEFKWKITDTIAAGDMEVWLDGVKILDITSGDSKNTANAYATDLLVGGDVGGSTTYQMYFDDFYWFDLTGSLNNAVKGAVRVQSLLPTGDGNSSQFTGSDGNSINNSLLVDETTPNGDTDYVESQTVGNKDLYATADTVAATNTIHAVIVNHVVKKTDTDAREIVAVVRTAATDFDATANKVLSSGYVNHQSVFEQNPNGSIPWTKTTVDGAEFGLKVAV